MAVAYNSRIATDGLVLALDAGNPKSYPGSGTSWSDLSGRSNTGTLANGPVYSSANGGSFGFDGTDDVVTLASNNISGLAASSTNFSISTWVKYNSVASFTAFFEKQVNASSSPGVVRLDLGWTGNTIYLTTSNSSAGTIDQGNFTYTNNTSLWYNIVLVCGDSLKNGYVNGVSTLSGTYTSTYPTNSFNLGIGGNIRKLNGSIAQTLVYNRVLTASEVQQNFNALRSRFNI